jgi:hypothetical protein
LAKKAKIQECKVCKAKGYSKDGFRKGFCPKHRAWYQKGYLDENGNIVDESKKPVREELYYVCKIQGCLKKHAAKGFCNSHYGSFKRGTLDENGNSLSLIGSLNKIGHCKVCRDKNVKLTKGFCPKHYDQHLRGFLDIDGKKLKELRVAKKYTYTYKNKEHTLTLSEWGELLKVNKGTMKSRFRKHNGDLSKILVPYISKKKKKCKVRNCKNKSHAKEFCNKHYQAHCKGNIDSKGNYLNGYISKKEKYSKNCKVDGCVGKYFSSGFCEYHNGHYKRKILDINGKQLRALQTKEERIAILKKTHETNKVRLTYKGMTKTLTEWAEYIGISVSAFMKRRSAGWPEDKLFSKKDFRKCQSTLVT